MSDPQSTPEHDESTSDETPMIPDELAPRQQSEDPVPNDPDAAGTEEDRRGGSSDPDVLP